MPQVQDQELDLFIDELIAEGYSDEDIEFAVQEWESEGKTQELETEDAVAVPTANGASDLEDFGSGLPTLEEVEREQHNIKAKAARGAISHLTGMSDASVEATAGFMAGALGIIEGAANVGSSLKFTLQGLFVPEFAQLMKDDPELRAAMYEAADVDIAGIDELQSLITQSETTFTEAAVAGNFTEAGRQAAVTTATALPSILATMTGIGGMVVLGGSAVGSSFEETAKDQDITDSGLGSIFGTSLLKGGYEFVSEYATRGILKRAGLLFKGGKVPDEYAEGVIKTIFKDFNIEGLSEAAADLAGSLTDALVHGVELDPNLLWQLADTYVVGGLLGGGVSLIGTQNRKVVSAKTEPSDKVDADKQSAAVINTMTDHKLSNPSADLSLIDSVIEEEVQNVKTRQEAHDSVVNDFTQEEATQVLEDTMEANKWETSISDENTPEVNYIYEEKAAAAKEKANATYEVVQEWPQTQAKADEITEQIEAKEKELDVKEKTLAKSENPNPASTQKIKEERQELKDKKEGLDKAMDEMRPTHANTKTRKRKADKAKKAEKVETTEEVRPKEVVKAEARKEKAADAVEVIKDENVPDIQKERATKEFFAANKKTIDNIVNRISKRHGSSKDIRSLVEAEIFARSTREDIGSERFNNTVYQYVNRQLAAQQKGKSAPTATVAKEFTEEFNEEKAYLDEQLAEEIINADDHARELKNLKSRYGASTDAALSVTVATSEGEFISEEVEKASQARDKAEKDVKAKAVEAVEGVSAEELVENYEGNTEKIFSILPSAAKGAKAFDALFIAGNPPLEEWQDYFGAEGRTGRDRRNRLKKRVQETIDLIREEGSTEGLDFSEAQNEAGNVLRDAPKKPTVKTLLPLLAKLKRSFPGTKIIISKARMIEDFIAAGIDPAKADTVKGYTDGEVVVLNPDKLDYETPIHEFGHLWAQATRSGRPELYQHAENLVKKSGLWSELLIKRDNPDSVYHGYSDARLVEEAIATGIGRVGEQMFDTNAEQSAWDKLVAQIYDFIGQRMGLAKIEDMNLDQILKLAAAEIVTGEQVLKPTDVVSIQESLIDFKEVPVGSTRDYSRSTPPAAELDTHGEFKGKSIQKQLFDVLNTYNQELLTPGSWFAFTTGNYGPETGSKYDPKLTARIEAKIKGARELLAKEGYTLKRDPKNPGMHIASRNVLNFQEESPAKDKGKVLKELFNDSYTYKNESPYKKSKIDQATREIIEATKRDFALRGESLNEDQIDNLILKLEELVKNGKKTQQEKIKARKAKRADNIDNTSNLIKDSSGVDPETLDQAQIDKQSKEKRTFITDLLQGKVFSAFSRALSPDSNNDFYGLLYNLMPSGKGRAEAKKFLADTVTGPLEEANYNQLEAKRDTQDNYKGLRKKHGITDKLISEESTVEVGGFNLTNSQIAKVYNYIKNPALYKQLEAGGIDVAKMEEILDYIDTKPNLKAYADEVPSIFAGGKAFINSKLDEHTYKGVAEPTIVTPDPGPAFDVLARVYGGNIPSTAPYTPFTATGADTTLDVEKVFDGDQTFYSVMSGNLKERTGGGALRIHGTSLEQDINGYIEGPLRTANYLDFARNVSDVFANQNIKAMEAAYGQEWGKSVKESLKTIITGKNRPANETKAQRAVINWMNKSVGGIMFLNVRSGVLQMISTGNFAVENPAAFAKGMTSSPKSLREAAKLISESAWYQERGAGKTGLEFDEVFSQTSETLAGKGLDWLIQSGYAVTKLGDKGAILLGGTPFVAGRIKEGATPEQALKEFIAMAEETQQSSRPERVGREQRSAFGRAILQFANTPMQYNRKMQKALKDMTAKDATLKERGAAANKILYYGAVQNVIFTALQQAIWTSLDLEDDEDPKGLQNALNSILDTILRGSGIIGASVAIAKNTLRAANKQQRADQKAKAALKAGLGISPALSAKARQLEKALVESKYPLSDGPVTVPGSVIRGANAVQFITNVPLDRAVKKFEGINDLGAEDLNDLDKTMRVLGWDRYAIDKSVQKSNPDR